MGNARWTRDELIVAFNLYCKIPFGKIHIRNPQVIDLARLLGRTPSAVSWKLANFASLDPALQRRAISGASHGAKGDLEVWNEFSSDWNRLGYESERLLAELTGTSLSNRVEAEAPDERVPEGKTERDAWVRARTVQRFFRESVLAAYEGACCISGLSASALLVASHISPWATDPANRVNPRNGLCLNALHDRAFDRGLITVTPECIVLVSPTVKKRNPDRTMQEWLLQYDGRKIRMPKRFRPDPVLLPYHNAHVFVGGR